MNESTILARLIAMGINEQSALRHLNAGRVRIDGVTVGDAQVLTGRYAKVVLYPDGATSTVGASLQGYASGTYEQLVAVFGAPGEPLDEDKSHVEWTVHTSHGVAYVYDYGDCHDCAPGCDRDPCLSRDEVTEWHVGGHKADVVEWVRAELAGGSA